jgi:hypothetical protein
MPAWQRRKPGQKTRQTGSFRRSSPWQSIDYP